MKYRPLWMEIDLDALRSNVRMIKEMVSGAQLLATIKQDAYGHGLVPVAKTLENEGVEFFGVGSLDEVELLRQAKSEGKILVLSPLMDRFADDCIRLKATPLVVDLGFAKQLNICAHQRGVTVGIHVKIDTGMGRIGPWHRNAVSFCEKLTAFRNLELEGFCTHFPSADCDEQFTRQQVEIFKELRAALEKRGIFFRHYHCANSAALINCSDAHFNLVRPGIILYGVDPCGRRGSFKPLLSVKSRVVFLKRMEQGSSVSYARSYTIPENTTIAVISVGYADGYPWALSNKGKVIIGKEIYPVVGRVCMDHIMVNVGYKTAIKKGDEVILLGGNEFHSITAFDLAQLSGTIPYEIFTGWSKSIPRIYGGNDKIVSG